MAISAERKPSRSVSVVERIVPRRRRFWTTSCRPKGRGAGPQPIEMPKSQQQADDGPADDRADQPAPPGQLDQPGGQTARSAAEGQELSVTDQRLDNRHGHRRQDAHQNRPAPTCKGRRAVGRPITSPDGRYDRTRHRGRVLRSTGPGQAATASVDKNSVS